MTPLERIWVATTTAEAADALLEFERDKGRHSPGWGVVRHAYEARVKRLQDAERQRQERVLRDTDG